MISPKLRSALSRLLDDLGEGKRLSELTASQRKLVKYATRFRYVECTPIKGDFIVNRLRGLK